MLPKTGWLRMFCASRPQFKVARFVVAHIKLLQDAGIRVKPAGIAQIAET